MFFLSLRFNHSEHVDGEEGKERQQAEEHLGKQWPFLVREECEDELPQLGAENWYEVEVPVSHSSSSIRAKPQQSRGNLEKVCS